MNVAWTENDYQIDCSNATQLPEYERIIAMNSKIGVDHILFAGQNTNVSMYPNPTLPTTPNHPPTHPNS